MYSLPVMVEGLEKELLVVITGGSLFSGIGGMDLAASIAGIDIRFQVEIDDFCRKVLMKHAPQYWINAKQFTDIRGVTGEQLGYVDVLFGGFPCQDISHAGKGIGLEGSRSGLWWEFARLIGEIRPRAVVLENVAAITFDGRGGTEVVAALAGLGYSAQWGIVSAADASAPHERKRWFCVGYRNGARFPESPDAARGQDSCDGIGNIEIHQPDRLIACEPRAASQILRAKTGLAYPYRQRREQISGYRADTRKRAFRSGTVVNTDSQYIKEQRISQSVETQLATSGRTGLRVAGKTRVTQSVMGRNADGLSLRMDGNRLMQHQYPARPNEPQYENEPSRLCERIPNRRNRIKALGNAVVPQVVYPIFKLLIERLTE